MNTGGHKKTKILAVIGGGSTYTPELVDGLARREKAFLPMEVHLMDIDSHKLSIVSSFCKRMLEHHGSNIHIKSFTNLEESIDNSDFIVSQIRVGGHEARQVDLELGLKYGLIGQETTGVGGFANALRSIPVSIDIAKSIAGLAPRALLINFTNPSGIITEAIAKYSKIKVIGLCNIPWLMHEDLSRALGAQRSSVELEYIGLNHFTWVYGVKVHGKDRMDDLLAKSGRLTKDRYKFPRELMANIRAVPSPYLQYYYDTEKMLATLRTAPSRAKEVMRIEQELLLLYQNKKLVSKPKALMQRGGAYYGEAAASLLSNIAEKKREIHILNLQNNGRFHWLPDTAVIEAPWKIGSDGFKAVKMHPVPPHIQGMVTRLKAYEELTIEAAVKGDRSLAFQALITNPLIGSAPKASAALEDLLKVNRQYLPRFYQ